MMPSINNQDPFLQVQADLLSQLDSSRPLFSSYLRIRSSASPTSPELIEAKKELEGVLRDLQADLADLTDAVSAVEADPYAFGLQIEEVRRRRRLVGDVGDELDRMRAELQRAVQPADGKAKGANGSMLPDPDAFDDHDDDDYAAAFEQQRQEELLHEQDEIMDGVSQTVGNLRQQADVFGRELDEQGQILEEVDHAADRVGRKLQTGMRRIGEVIKRNEDTWSSFCIGALIVVLVVLLILLLLL